MELVCLAFAEELADDVADQIHVAFSILESERFSDQGVELALLVPRLGADDDSLEEVQECLVMLFYGNVGAGGGLEISDELLQGLRGAELVARLEGGVQLLFWGLGLEDGGGLHNL